MTPANPPRAASGEVAWTLEPPPVLRAPPDAPRLAGLEFGKLRVLGYGGSWGNPKSARWVCRCDCGRHGYRRTGTLRPKAASRAMCPDCDRAAYAASRRATWATGDEATDDGVALDQPDAIARYLRDLARDVALLPPDSPALRLASVLAGEIKWGIGQMRARQGVGA